MLELLTGTPPLSLRGEIIFDLKGPFNNLSDIVDSGPLNVPISRVGSISVGTDEDGSFIRIPSNRANYISFGGAVFNGPNIIVELSIKIMDDSDSLVFDTRPTSGNGNYSFLGMWNRHYYIRLPPTQNNVNGVNNATISPASYRILRKLRFEYLEDMSYFYCDDVLYATLPTIFNHVNQTYRIGYHAHINSTQTSQLYRFRVSRL